MAMIALYHLFSRCCVVLSSNKNPVSSAMAEETGLERQNKIG